MTATSSRFSMIELDTATPATTPEPAAPVAPPAPPAEPVRSADDGWAGPGVSASGKARAQEDEAAARAAGFNPAPPIYEIGRLVNYMGVENFKRSQMEFEDMATVDEACGHLRETVKNENRVDIVCDVPDLHMLDNGDLRNIGADGNGDTYQISRRAFQGLCGFVTPGGAGYLSECDPVLRAYNVNKWLVDGFRKDRRATTALIKDFDIEAARSERYGTTTPDRPDDILIPRAVTLRTRTDGSETGRELFAVVGPNYGEHDIDKIAAQIMEGVPSDARCNVVYDGYKARIDVLFHSDIQPDQAVAGEIFKAGVCITAADDGTGSIKISAEMWRNLCLNLFIIDNAKELVLARRHFGAGIGAAVEKGILEAQSKIGYFMNKWGEATLENVVERYKAESADTVLRALAFNKVVHIPGVKKEEMYKRLRRAWDKEPGHNRTAFVNAVTRCAHEETWQRWTDCQDLERLGGKLLYAKVWNVEITPENAESLGNFA